MGLKHKLGDIANFSSLIINIVYLVKNYLVYFLHMKNIF